MLRHPHGPIPRNPLIAESLFRIRYAEKVGTGTTDMIADCRTAGLPEPEFEQRGPHFVVTLWRDWLTADVIAKLDLNERQLQAVAHVKKTGRITNSEYRQLTGATRKTATRDLNDLVEKKVLTRVGVKRGSFYKISRGK